MTYDLSTVTALQSGALLLHDLLYVSAWDGSGDPAHWGFWTGPDNIIVSVIGALTGSSTSRDYVGGGTLLDVSPIVEAMGLESRSAQFELGHLDTDVLDAILGGNWRAGRVELHRAVYAPETGELVSTPYARFVGRVDTVQIRDAAVGGTGGLTLSCSDDRVDLTRTNLALKSDAQQQLRGGDDFRQYSGTAGQIEVWWGQQKGTE